MGFLDLAAQSLDISWNGSKLPKVQLKPEAVQTAKIVALAAVQKGQNIASTKLTQMLGGSDLAAFASQTLVNAGTQKLLSAALGMGNPYGSTLTVANVSDVSTATAVVDNVAKLYKLQNLTAGKLYSSARISRLTKGDAHKYLHRLTNLFDTIRATTAEVNGIKYPRLMAILHGDLGAEFSDGTFARNGSSTSPGEEAAVNRGVNLPFLEDLMHSHLTDTSTKQILSTENASDDLDTSSQFVLSSELSSRAVAGISEQSDEAIGGVSPNAPNSSSHVYAMTDEMKANHDQLKTLRNDVSLALRKVLNSISDTDLVDKTATAKSKVMSLALQGAKSDSVCVTESVDDDGFALARLFNPTPFEASESIDPTTQFVIPAIDAATPVIAFDVGVDDSSSSAQIDIGLKSGEPETKAHNFDFTDSFVPMITSVTTPNPKSDQCSLEIYKGWWKSTARLDSWPRRMNSIVPNDTDGAVTAQTTVLSFRLPISKQVIAVGDKVRLTTTVQYVQGAPVVYEFAATVSSKRAHDNWISYNVIADFTLVGSELNWGDTDHLDTTTSAGYAAIQGFTLNGTFTGSEDQFMDMLAKEKYFPPLVPESTPGGDSVRIIDSASGSPFTILDALENRDGTGTVGSTTHIEFKVVLIEQSRKDKVPAPNGDGIIRSVQPFNKVVSSNAFNDFLAKAKTPYNSVESFFNWNSGSDFEHEVDNSARPDGCVGPSGDELSDMVDSYGRLSAACTEMTVDGTLDDGGTYDYSEYSLNIANTTEGVAFSQAAGVFKYNTLEQTLMPGQDFAWAAPIGYQTINCLSAAVPDSITRTFDGKMHFPAQINNDAVFTPEQLASMNEPIDDKLPAVVMYVATTGSSRTVDTNELYEALKTGNTGTAITGRIVKIARATFSRKSEVVSGSASTGFKRADIPPVDIAPEYEKATRADMNPRTRALSGLGAILSTFKKAKEHAPANFGTTTVASKYHPFGFLKPEDGKAAARTIGGVARQPKSVVATMHDGSDKVVQEIKIVANTDFTVGARESVHAFLFINPELRLAKTNEAIKTVPDVKHTNDTYEENAGGSSTSDILHFFKVKQTKAARCRWFDSSKQPTCRMETIGITAKDDGTEAEVPTFGSTIASGSGISFLSRYIGNDKKSASSVEAMTSEAPASTVEKSEITLLSESYTSDLRSVEHAHPLCAKLTTNDLSGTSANTTIVKCISFIATSSEHSADHIECKLACHPSMSFGVPSSSSSDNSLWYASLNDGIWKSLKNDSGFARLDDIPISEFPLKSGSIAKIGSKAATSHGFDVESALIAREMKPALWRWIRFEADRILKIELPRTQRIAEIQGVAELASTYGSRTSGLVTNKNEVSDDQAMPPAGPGESNYVRISAVYASILDRLDEFKLNNYYQANENLSA